MGTLEAGQYGLLAVLMLSSLLGLYYLLEVPVKAFFFPPPPDAHHGPGIKEAPLPSVVAIVITATATVGLFFFPDLAYDLMAMVVTGGGR
jgi:multicomponent Na+:H+ antiporter subunit D